MMVMMEGLRPVVEEMFSDQDSAELEIDGIGNFEQRVVYAKVLPRSKLWFKALVDTCREAVNAAGPGVRSNNSLEFLPHITIAMVSRAVAKLGVSSLIPEAAYTDHMHMRFGRQEVNNLHLCVFEEHL